MAAEDPDAEFPFSLVGQPLTKRSKNIAGGTVDLSAAKGRISLRIDLPKEGDVYHFAQLGGAGGVSFEAAEDKGAFLEGVLALLCAAAAVFVFRFRAR
jgi:hypothetical protein